MNWGYAFDSAKALTLALLRGLDPAQHEVALVTFDDDAALKTGFTRDLVAVSGQVAALRTGADTRMGSGLEAALRLFEQPAPAPDALRIVFLVSDGVPSDDVTGQLARAESAGIEIHALLIESGQMSDPIFVDGLIGSRVLRGVSEIDIAQYSDEMLSPRRTEAGLFREITVTDELPTNMAFVEGSAVPAASVNGRILTWQLPDVLAQDGVRLTYKVRPLEPGVWPTNVRATAAYTDALGAPGALVYPVPQVEVIAGTHHVYLPLLTKQLCIKRERSADVILVVDTSGSMSEPAVGGGTKLDAARVAAGAFLGMLRLPQDWAAIVSFNENGSVEAPLTGDLEALQAALAGLTPSPGTRIDAGLDAASAALEDRRPEARAAIVLLSDGRHGGAPEDVVTRARVLRDQGVLIYAIALGADADVDLLGEVAGAPERLFVSADDASLQRIYAEVSERLACDVR
jgi:Mg-chelatase subunit ChlD